MHVKLTLSAEPAVVDLAKQLAQQRGISVSAMFADFVLGAGVRSKTSVKQTPVLRRLRGIIKLPKGKTSRQVLTDILAEKHGL